MPKAFAPEQISQFCTKQLDCFSLIHIRTSSNMGKNPPKKPNYDQNFTDKKQFKKLFSQFKLKETKNFW